MKNLLKVQPFQETLYGGYCGPASLKIVFNYYGVQRSEKEIARRCGHDARLGTTDASMKKAAESYGFKAEIKNKASFADITKWLKRGVPVIVDWFTPGRPSGRTSEMPDGHSSVVMGLDTKNIYLQDPEIGAMRTIQRDDFLRVWFDFKKERVTTWKDMIIRQLIAIYPALGLTRKHPKGKIQV